MDMHAHENAPKDCNRKCETTIKGSSVDGIVPNYIETVYGFWPTMLERPEIVETQLQHSAVVETCGNTHATF